MSTIEQVARAFARGESAQCHNARTDGRVYWLHGNPIAHKPGGDRIVGNWCGWYTVMTANQPHHIAGQYGAARVSYAQARDNGIREFDIV